MSDAPLLGFGTGSIMNNLVFFGKSLHLRTCFKTVFDLAGLRRQVHCEVPKMRQDERPLLFFIAAVSAINSLANWTKFTTLPARPTAMSAPML